MQSNRAGMLGKKIADDFSPRAGDLFLAQATFKSEFRSELNQHLANRERSVQLFLGFRQPAPLFDDESMERLRHKEKDSPATTHPDLRVSGALLTATIAADGFHRTSLHRLFAQRFLVRRLRLFIDKGMPTVIVARKICRCRLTAKIAINALIIDVKLPTHILRILICNVCHNLLYNAVTDSRT